MEFDPLLLSRIQFAFTISWHIIFPSFTIGLAAWIATLEFLWLRSGNDDYHTLARFWTKIFAVSFAMGVVSGIVLSYQFGTNWSGFSRVLGEVIGPLVGYEVLAAFFLEATFLGVMLFGWNRVPPGLHFLATLAVAVGTFMSAFWILAANSWMQTPAGHVIVDGIVKPQDWLQIIFNPSFPLRFTHMIIAAYLTTAFVVLAVGARYILAKRHREHSKIMMRMALGMSVLLAPAQAVVGDLHGLFVRDYQPAKLAAIEAHWDGAEPVDLVLFAWPNTTAERNDFEIAIPSIGSLILTHEWDGRIPGLKDFPKEDRPPIWGPFFGFRLMVAIGLVMIGMAFVGVWLMWRGELFSSRNYLKAASWCWPIGFVAVIAGWVVAETGRQPWVATGILRTADAVSPVSGETVAVTLTLFVVIYTITFSSGIYYINRLINRGPDPDIVAPPLGGLPNRPISAAEEAARAAAHRGEPETGPVA